MLTIQVLKRARKLLSKGWCQEAAFIPAYHGKPDSFCLIGATSFATKARWPREAIKARERIREALPPGSVSIIDFNDDPGRTQEQVLEVMDKAIKLEAAGLPWWQRVLP